MESYLSSDEDNCVETLPIDGLRWSSRWRMHNGRESYVIPYPTTYPANLVWHGHRNFNYGHYGIHLGQEDCLTFLGPSHKNIYARFIDCRENSPTLHQFLELTFNPSSKKTLHIPPGVAHTFFGLEDVFTVNDYKLFLPNPQDWLEGLSPWKIENDIVNMSLDADKSDWLILRQNQFPASNFFYNLVVSRQRRFIPNIKTEFPISYDVETTNNNKVRVYLKKIVSVKEDHPVLDSIPLSGVKWEAHPVVRTGDESGITPLLDGFPFYIVDHGEDKYSHDCFGIHLGQEDRLTFVGPQDQTATVTMVDCREGSATLHQVITMRFSSDPKKFLVIPPGVAHRFDNLENIFTINRPRSFLDKAGNYRPGDDVIDWPMEARPFPILQPNQMAASDEYYEKVARLQKEALLLKAKYTAPKVRLLTNPHTGLPVRVVIREPSVHN